MMHAPRPARHGRQASRIEAPEECLSMSNASELAARDLRVVWHPCTQMKDHELLPRPIGNVVYFMPPYVIEPGEIDRLVATARDGIEAATCD